VTVPPRSRTKPASTNRRPKVAGRQHAHAGTATRRPDDEPDLLDGVEAPDVLDAPAVDDRPGGPAPSTTPPSAPDDAPADGTPDRETPPVAATTQPADTEDAAGTPEATEAATTGSVAPTAGPVAAADTEALSVPATSADPEAGSATGTDAADTAATETVEDTTLTDTTATTTASPARTKARKRGGMAPRAEAATAPTRERPARRGIAADDDTVTATPTRTAKPTRTGGTRAGEPEPAPRTGRLAGVRAALARFGRSRALPVTLVVVIVVCLVLAGLAFWQGRQAWTEGPVANDAVVDVGGTAELVGQSREAVEKIFSYDFTRLDDSVDAARTMSTNPFTDRYLQVFDQTIRVPAQQQQLTQTATVVNIGVTTMSDDRAEVMALTQFSAQRTTTGQSTNAPGLLRLQLERIDGRWKLAELTPLTAPR
jgi:Mce-associated membrane protein